jgi:hypothetical protein
MKHVQPYQEFINESESKELTRQEFTDLAIQSLGNKELYRWDPINPEEEASLVSLFNHIDTNGGDGGYYKKLTGEDLRFRIVLNKGKTEIGRQGYPRIQVGKISTTIWTVDTSDDIPGEIYLSNSYNTFTSLQDAIAFIAAKYGPRTEWVKIR